ncbi:MAG: efflux RND transporter periplasmic adaptor subunit [Firmicutes bacterium]|nr:efflux RND transporter periplasmic adaptor subunit [Bacillota bacterium]
MKRTILVISVLASVCLAAAGCGSKSTAPAGGGKGMAVPVAVQPVKRADIARELVVSGQLAGEQSVVVSPKITGKVDDVRFELGSRVARGDVLFTMDDTDIVAQVQQYEASVAASAARKKVAEQNRENASRQFERYNQLYEQGAISADTFESYKLKLDQALSEEPESNLAQMEASLSYQRNQLANTVVTSPISGEVAVKNVEIGSMVSSSTQAVTVVNLEQVKVQLPVGEQQVGKLKQGQEVKVLVPSVREEQFNAVIANISPAADPKTKSFLVEVKMDNPEHVLKQGMFAKVHIATDRKEKALTLPVDAVVARSGDNYVFTVVEGKAKENKVKVGISDGKVTEIIEGLAEGDQAIVLGQQGLINGSPVLVQGAQEGSSGQGKGDQPKGEK